MTITVDGRRIDAVAQVTKQGFTFVFDRVTGKPVWPIVERPVPTDSDVPGEKPYPTQPFPDQAAGVRRSRRVARRREQPDAGDQGAGAGADAEVPASVRCSRRLAARHAAAAGAGRRRELGRRGVRSRDRLSVRARDATASA